MSARTAAILLTGLLMVDVAAVTPVLAHRDDAGKMADLNHIRGDKDLAAFLNHQRRPFRVEMETDEVPVSWPAYNGFDEIKSSGASITVNRTQTEFWTPQNRDLEAVGFTIGRTSAMPDARQVFEGASGMKVFENPHAFPRAWAVHELFTVATLPQAQGIIRDRLDDLKTKAFTIGNPGPAFQTACSEPDVVEITRYEPTRVAIESKLACDGMVLLSDTWYPGWNATVDNRPAPIIEVDIAMRGVKVPKGGHRIEYRYQPVSVYLGAALTALGSISATLIALLLR